MTTCVLIVEDEWVIAEDHTMTLRDAGYEIVGPCASVSEARKHDAPRLTA